MSLFTGDEAFEIIKPNFCHLLDVYTHDSSAHDALYILILVIALDANFYNKKLEKLKKPLSAFLMVTTLLLAFLIGKTAHQGAMLVYDKGAGVKPVMSSTCTP